MRKTSEHLETLASTRAYLAELIAVAIAISFGVNLLAGGFVPLFAITPSISVVFGIGMVTLSCAYLAWRVGPRIKRKMKLTGAFILKGQDFLDVDRYKFAEEVRRATKALKAENKALWNMLFSSSEGRKGPGTRLSDSTTIILELVEYFVLKQLSFHLEAYFGRHDSIQKDLLVKLGRPDVPDVLLQNRVLELFSRPMEERELFSDRDKDAPGTIVYATGPGGAIFDHFELVLPPRTKVTRVNPGELCITTERFALRVKVIFEGFAFVPPSDFIEMYLGQDYFNVNKYMIILDISVSFKVRSLFTERGWQYYQWLDSFLDRLSLSFDFEHFIKAIGWETAVTVARIQARNQTKSSTTGVGKSEPTDNG